MATVRLRVDKKNQRKRKKNEATGVRIVAQVTQEFWECGWQPRDARNDRGIDGQILLAKRGNEIGANVNVQAKCGNAYISSETESVIRLSLGTEDYLNEHIDHWNNQLEPVVLVFTKVYEEVRTADGTPVLDKEGKIKVKENRYHPKSWWVDLRDNSAYPEGTRTIIEISKKNTFGHHSKKDFLNLVWKYKSDWLATKVELTEESKRLVHSNNLARDARAFYKKWQGEKNTRFNPLSQEVIISRFGWKHITRKKRGNIRRNFSFKYLGAAKQIINEAKAFQILGSKKIEDDDGINFKQINYIGVLGSVKDTGVESKAVQVILLQEIKYQGLNITNRIWFYSIHERKSI